MPCACGPVLGTLEKSKITSAKDLTLPSQPLSRNSWPSSASHFPLFYHFLADPQVILEAVRTILPLTAGSHLCLYRPCGIHNPHPLTTALHPALSEIPWASGLTRCSGSRVTSVNEETEPHPCPSPNYRTLKWASSPDTPALFWGSSISAGAGCCPHGSASCSEVGPSTLLHLSRGQSCPKPDPQFLHIYPHSV